MNTDGSDLRRIGINEGRSTCSSFLLGDNEFIYSSTMSTLGKGCPPVPISSGYVWPVYKTMAIYKASWPSGNIIKKLTDTGAYDAEATVSPDGQSIVLHLQEMGI